jgi:hypothetical protein
MLPTSSRRLLALLDGPILLRARDSTPVHPFFLRRCRNKAASSKSSVLLLDGSVSCFALELEYVQPLFHLQETRPELEIIYSYQLGLSFAINYLMIVLASLKKFMIALAVCRYSRLATLILIIECAKRYVYNSGE